MRTDRATKQVRPDRRETHEEAQAILRQVVNATRANLADMDRLLDRAERLVSIRIDTYPIVRTD